MNSLEPYLFYLFASIAVASALVVVASKRPTYSVLALTLTMLALSALFVLLKAYFVAVMQVLIYAGAILVLFLFVIMLLGVDGAEQPAMRTKFLKSTKTKRAVQAFLVLIFLLELSISIAKFQLDSAPQVQAGTVEAIGTMLFGRYLLPFELVSGILLIGIFGVVSLAHDVKNES